MKKVNTHSILLKMKILHTAFNIVSVQKNDSTKLRLPNLEKRQFKGYRADSNIIRV